MKILPAIYYNDLLDIFPAVTMISDEDKALFRANNKGTKPLKQTEKPAKITPPALTRAVKKSLIEPSRASWDYPLSDHLQEEIQAESILSYHQNLPAKRWRALKNGHLCWEARLDLHGLKSNEARHMLCAFIYQQQQIGKRCLLIIHGKGGSRGEAPVLKNLLYRWLPQFPEVLAFHSAQPRDGGNGAVYVLLRRL